MKIKKLFVVVSIVSSLLLTGLVYAQEELPILDVEKYGVFDTSTKGMLVHQGQDDAIKPFEISKIFLAIGLYQKDKLEKDTDLDNVWDNVEDSLKKYSSDQLYQEINDSLKEIGIENTNIVSLDGNKEQDTTTIKDIGTAFSYFMTNVVGRDKIDIESKKEEVSIKEYAKNDKELLSVKIGKKDESLFVGISKGGATAESNDQDTDALIKYAMSMYRTYKVVSKGEELGKIKIKGGRKSYSKVVALDDMFVTLPKEAEDSIVKKNLVLAEELTAPVEKNKEVGMLQALEAGEITAQVKIITGEDVVVGGPWSKVGISDYMFFTGLCVIVLLLVLIIIRKRKIANKKRQLEMEREERIKREAMRIAMERAEKRRRNWPY